MIYLSLATAVYSGCIKYSSPSIGQVEWTRRVAYADFSSLLSIGTKGHVLTITGLCNITLSICSPVRFRYIVISVPSSKRILHQKCQFKPKISQLPTIFAISVLYVTTTTRIDNRDPKVVFTTIYSEFRYIRRA
jgi:hypothetical protein